MNKFLRKAFSKNPDPKTKGGVLVKGGVLDNEILWFYKHITSVKCSFSSFSSMLEVTYHHRNWKLQLRFLLRHEGERESITKRNYCLLPRFLFLDCFSSFFDFFFDFLPTFFLTFKAILHSFVAHFFRLWNLRRACHTHLSL